jgi:hypothetical protein
MYELSKLLVCFGTCVVLVSTVLVLSRTSSSILCFLPIAFSPQAANEESEIVYKLIRQRKRDASY